MTVPCEAASSRPRGRRDRSMRLGGTIEMGAAWYANVVPRATATGSRPRGRTGASGLFLLERGAPHPPSGHSYLSPAGEGGVQEDVMGPYPWGIEPVSPHSQRRPSVRRVASVRRAVGDPVADDPDDPGRREPGGVPPPPGKHDGRGRSRSGPAYRPCRAARSGRSRPRRADDEPGLEAIEVDRLVPRLGRGRGSRPPGPSRPPAGHRQADRSRRGEPGGPNHRDRIGPPGGDDRARSPQRR